MVNYRFLLTLAVLCGIRPVVSAQDGDMPHAETVCCKVCNVFRDDADAGYVFMTLSASNGIAYAFSHCQGNTDAVLKQLRSYIGCLVKIECAAMPFSQFGVRRHVKLGYHFNSTNDITVLAKSSKGPFDAPLLNEEPPSLSEIDVCGTRKVKGVVKARWHGDTFAIQTKDGECLRVRLQDQDSLPALEESVEVVGEVATDLYRYNLFQARWRPSEDISIPANAVKPIQLENIFYSNGRRTINTHLHGETIRVRGTLKSVLTDEYGHMRLLIADRDMRIVADCSALSGACTFSQEGSYLEVTGVAFIESENWHPNLVFPRIIGIFLIPRTATDITVLRQPPWWTPARFAIALLVLLAILIAILVWNTTLRILVTRKSRALLKEQALKLTETLKVDERTRLAAELHDFHSQNLTAIAYQISDAQAACQDRNSTVAQCLATAADMLRSCRTDLRRCLWDLRADTLDLPDFAEAIRLTVTPVSGEANLSVRFSGHRSLISDSTAHAVLSILRELTANAVHHGHAQNVRIAGEQKADSLRFSVRDNGCGFDPALRPNQDSGHFGLDSIQERMNRLGGLIEIQSASGQGTCVRITIRHSLRTST